MSDPEMPADRRSDGTWLSDVRHAVTSQVLTQLTGLRGLRSLQDDPATADLRGRVEELVEDVRNGTLPAATWRGYGLSSRVLAAGFIWFLRRIADVGLEQAAGEADKLLMLDPAQAASVAGALLVAPFAGIPDDALPDETPVVAEAMTLLRPVVLEMGGNAGELDWLQRRTHSIDLADRGQCRDVVGHLNHVRPFVRDAHGLLLYIAAWRGSSADGDEELEAVALEDVAVCAVRSGGSSLARDRRLALLRDVVSQTREVIRRESTGPLTGPAVAVVVEYAAHMLAKAEAGRRYYAREAARILDEVDAVCADAPPGLRCRFLELALLAHAYPADRDTERTMAWLVELGRLCTTAAAIEVGWHPGAAAASLCGVAGVLARNGSIAAAREAWDFTGPALKLLRLAETAELEGDELWYLETRGRLLSIRSEIALRHDDAVSGAALQELYDTFCKIFARMFGIELYERRVGLVAQISFALRSLLNPGALDGRPDLAQMVGALLAGMARVVAVEVRRSPNVHRDVSNEVYHLFRLAMPLLDQGASPAERLQTLVDRGDALFDIGLVPYAVNAWGAAVKIAVESADRDVFQPVQQPFAPALAGVCDRMAVGYVLADDPNAGLQMLEMAFGLPAQRWLAARDAADSDQELRLARDMMRAELLGEDSLGVLGLGQDVVVGRAWLAEVAGRTVGERILRSDWFPRAELEAELAMFAGQANGLAFIFMTAAAGHLVIQVLDQTPPPAGDHATQVEAGHRLETQPVPVGDLFMEARDWRSGVCGPATEHVTALVMSLVATIARHGHGAIVCAARGWLGGLPFDIAERQIGQEKAAAGRVGAFDRLSFAPGRIALADACRLARGARPGTDMVHIADPDAGFAFADVEAAVLDHACAGRRKELHGRTALQALLQGRMEQPILHISCHGLHDPNDPDASFLRLGHDAILHPRLALGALDLRGTRVVFLSSCQTAELAMASPDSYYGLAQSVMLAGAPAVVATRWAVDERAALLVASRFYENLAASPPCDALHEAKTWLRELDVQGLTTWLNARGVADIRIAEMLHGGPSPAYPKGFGLPPASKRRDARRPKNKFPFSAARHWGAFILFGV